MNGFVADIQVLPHAGCESVILPLPEMRRSDTFKLDNEWGFNVDNHFAANVFEAISKLKLRGLPDVRNEAQLCEICSTLELSRAAFRAQRDVDRLQQMAQTCDLSRLLWRACKEGGTSRSSRVTHWRVLGPGCG